MIKWNYLRHEDVHSMIVLKTVVVDTFYDIVNSSNFNEYPNHMYLYFMVRNKSDLQIRVRIGKLFSLFRIQNIRCG